MEAYELKGIDKGNPSTWNRICPTIEDVYKCYIDRDDVKQDKLYSALNELSEFSIFEPDGRKTKSLYEIIEGVTVIDVSGYSESIQELVIAITLDVFYREMIREGHSAIKGNLRELTNLILVDEADNFLRKGFDSIRKILKEGRAFGVGTILSTQYLSHFTTTDNNYGQYISNWVVHKVDEMSIKDAKRLFNAYDNDEANEYINKVRSLKKHYSITNISNDKRAIYIKDKPFWEMVRDNMYNFK
jgi:DNA phosphorothioation-dependent restriction protein DptH